MRSVLTDTTVTSNKNASLLMRGFISQSLVHVLSLLSIHILMSRPMLCLTKN